MLEVLLSLAATVELSEQFFARTALVHPEEHAVLFVSPCTKVSMYNDEIFIIGKPPILLHSKDAGKSWERVPLSPKVCFGRLLYPS